MIAAIDAGYTGAICLYDNYTYNLIDMPTMLDIKGRKLINGYEIARLLTGCSDVGIEKVNSMPNQGSSSTFRFGEGYGIVQGCAMAVGCKVHYIQPVTWKKQANLIGSAKDYARTEAIRKFPELAHLLTRKKDIGRADSLFIMQNLMRIL